MDDKICDSAPVKKKRKKIYYNLNGQTGQFDVTCKMQQNRDYNLFSVLYVKKNKKENIKSRNGIIITNLIIFYSVILHQQTLCFFFI